jgi:hypothetical protein
MVSLQILLQRFNVLMSKEEVEKTNKQTTNRTQASMQWQLCTELFR